MYAPVSFLVKVSELPFGDACSFRFDSEAKARAEFLDLCSRETTINASLQKIEPPFVTVLDEFESGREAVADPRDEMFSQE